MRDSHSAVSIVENCSDEVEIHRIRRQQYRRLREYPNDYNAKGDVFRPAIKAQVITFPNEFHPTSSNSAPVPSTA